METSESGNEKNTSLIKTRWFEANALCEMSEWGIGFQIGKTRYSKWRFFALFDFLCFLFVVWFGRKKEEKNKKGFLMAFEIETKTNTG